MHIPPTVCEVISWVILGVDGLGYRLDDKNSQYQYGHIIVVLTGSHKKGNPKHRKGLHQLAMPRLRRKEVIPYNIRKIPKHREIVPLQHVPTDPRNGLQYLIPIRHLHHVVPRGILTQGLFEFLRVREGVVRFLLPVSVAGGGDGGGFRIIGGG